MNNISISQLSVVLTYSCNLKCSYCFVSNKKDITTISKETIHKAIRMWQKYLSKNSDSLKLLFTGGEPLLKKDLILSFINEARYKYPEINFEYHITTNGLLLTKCFIEEVKSKNIYLCVSIDGNEKANVERFVNQTSAKFENLKKNLQMYSAILDNNKLRVRMTITPKSVFDFFDNINYLLSIGIKNIHFSPNYETNWNNDEINKYFSEYERISELLPNKDIIIEPYFSFKKNGVQKNGPYEHDCSFLPTIDTNGNVFYCPRFAGKNDNILGSVNNPSEVLLNFRKTIRTISNIFSKEKLNFLCPSNYLENKETKIIFNKFYNQYKCLI